MAWSAGSGDHAWAGLEGALRVLSGSDRRRLAIRTADAAHGSRVLERYAAVPRLPHPRALLPVDSGAATLRTALEQHAAGAGSALARSAARALCILNRLGIAAPLLRSRVAVVAREPDLEETPMHGFLAYVLGQRDFAVSLRLAPGRPNGKPVVQAIAPDGSVLAYAKFGWEAITRDLIRHEAATLNELAPLIGRTSLRVPEILHAGTWCGLETLVLAPLDAVGHRPRHPAAIPVAATGALASLPARTASRLVDSSFWQRTTGRSAASAPALPPPARDLLPAAILRVGSGWGDLRLPFGWVHGDWIPANILIRSDGLVAAWDWERAAPDGPLGIDTMQFLVYLEMRRLRPDWRPGGRLTRLGQRALVREGLDPAAAPLLAALLLIEMLLWYAEAADVGRRVDQHRIAAVSRALAALLDLR